MDSFLAPRSIHLVGNLSTSPASLLSSCFFKLTENNVDVVSLIYRSWETEAQVTYCAHRYGHSLMVMSF